MKSFENFDFDKYSGHVDVVRQVCEIDPLSLTMVALARGLDSVRAVRAMDDAEAASSMLYELRTRVLLAVSQHHHRSAELAALIIGAQS